MSAKVHYRRIYGFSFYILFWTASVKIWSLNFAQRYDHLERFPKYQFTINDTGIVNTYVKCYEIKKEKIDDTYNKIRWNWKKKETVVSKYEVVFSTPLSPNPLGDPGDNIRCRSRGTSISRLAGWSRSLVDSKINYSSVHRKCTSILSWPLVCFSSAARIVAQSGVGIGVPFEVDQLTAADESRDGWPSPLFSLPSFLFSPLLFSFSFSSPPRNIP